MSRFSTQRVDTSRQSSSGLGMILPRSSYIQNVFMPRNKLLRTPNGAQTSSTSNLLKNIKMVTESQPRKNPFGRESTVLVVGASRGLGLEFVKQLLSKGSYVLATYRGSEPPKELKNLEPSSSGRLQLVECDVASGESIQAAAESMKGR